MDMLSTMLARRTCRRFDARPVTREQLTLLMEAARLAPSGANLQPMRYCAVSDEAVLSAIHPHVHWAGYTAPLGSPAENERPKAYICLVADTSVKAECAQDEGIAGAAITYAAEALGLATCWLGAIDRKEIASIIHMGEGMKLMSMIAVGYPIQTRVLEEGNGIKYWLEGDVLHVPKRPASDTEFFDSL